MSSILGRLSPQSFLRNHWQKRPLLIRQAFPGFEGILDRDALLDLTTRAEVTSRLVIEHRIASSGARRRSQKNRWERHDGPFASLDPSMLPANRWTVLVHGIESLVTGGWEILKEFSFIPAARVDDLMVSYATDGGSVGPHEDRYDVFLLQGPGRRRWQVSSRGDHQFDERAAIKVLSRFEPEEEWLLEPGDMLYLPPGVAHLGVAEGPCFTYSIGFLAPSHVDLVQSFLGYLSATLPAEIDPERLYEDPDLHFEKNRLAVSDAMVRQVASILNVVRWDKQRVEDFLGCFLTRPKPSVIFTPPVRPLSPKAFDRRLRSRGRLTLALPTRGLVREDRIFLNGEAHHTQRRVSRIFQALVDTRSISLPVSADAHVQELLYSWYRAGYLS